MTTTKSSKSLHRHLCTARIIEWNDAKGFGFLQHDKNRLFLHRRDFTDRRKKPVVGDKIRFTIGQDQQGRPCARNAEFASATAGLGIVALVLLGLLLIGPVMALRKLSISPLYVAGYILVINMVAFVVYASDKRRAQAGERRIPEQTLHLLEILGGWPAAFLAQRVLRHKSSKVSYQIAFWLIVLLYQFVAIDFQRDWKVSQEIARVVQNRGN